MYRKYPMKPETPKIEKRRQVTRAGRDELANALQSVQRVTALFEDAARSGHQTTLLDAAHLWEKAVARVQHTRQITEEMVGEELETWIES